MAFRSEPVAGAAAAPAANIFESALGIPDITGTSAGLIIIGNQGNSRYRGSVYLQWFWMSGYICNCVWIKKIIDYVTRDGRGPRLEYDKGCRCGRHWLARKCSRRPSAAEKI
jgi:hypothetical protein